MTLWLLHVKGGVSQNRLKAFDKTLKHLQIAMINKADMQNFNGRERYDKVLLQSEWPFIKSENTGKWCDPM